MRHGILLIALWLPACHSASNDRVGPDDDVATNPLIEIDVTKDAVDWKGKPLSGGGRSGEGDRVEVRVVMPVTISVEVFNSREGAIRIDRRLGTAWHGGLYRNGRLLDNITVFRAEPRPEDLVTIKAQESTILSLPLSATTTDEITAGRYLLVITIAIHDSEIPESAPRNLKRTVEVIVKK